jgi:hypothetical protein
LVALLDDSLLRAVRRITPTNAEQAGMVGDIIPELKIVAFRDGEVEFEFKYHSTAPAIRVAYSAASSRVWRLCGAEDLHIHLDFSDTRIFDGSLTDYLEQFRPRLVMPKGGVVIGRDYLTSSRPSERLPDNCLQSINWDGCDIAIEDGETEPDLQNIHNWIAQWLKETTSSEALVLKDHGSGEIADFVVIETHGSTRRVDFYHCKSMSGKAPGNRVDDGYEVLGQACRNSPWIMSPQLFSELWKRNQNRKAFSFCKGKLERLDNLREEFSCNDWQYGVTAVQPGFACAQIAKGSRLLSLLLATYEWLRNCEAEFRVWGS